MTLATEATTEQLLAASEARFHALLENAADITSIVGGDGTITFVSRSVSRVLGYDADGFVGKAGFEFVHPDDEPAAREFLAATMSADGPTHGPPFRAIAADGSWRMLEPMGLNLLGDPEVDGVVVTVRDVTERHDISERLAQSERLEAIGQLAGGIAHDFNNVLLVIRGYSGVLRSALADSEHIGDIDEIAHAADRAAELTRQLLAFARRQVLQPVLVDLREIVCGIETLLRRSVSETIETDLQLDDDLPPVLADAAQMEQVLMNLVVNSRDAMPDGGRLSISIAPVRLERDARVSPLVPEGAYVALSVVDTGTGIEPQHLPRIFEPFFTTKVGVGTGLGLSTVYGIVAQSGGAIEVAAPPGGGTRITVYLPAAAGEVDAEASEAAELRLPVGSERILLVEDEDPVRDLVSRVLQAAGYDVLAAARPSEAQRLVAEHEFDLLVTDVVMPEMSGYDLASRVHLAQPGVQTLFISGYAHKALGEASETPQGELLRKPFSPEELTRAVRAILDGETLDAA